MTLMTDESSGIGAEIAREHRLVHRLPNWDPMTVIPQLNLPFG